MNLFTSHQPKQAVTIIANDMRDDLRTLSNRAVEKGMDPNSPEVVAVMKAYHALAGAFGYPADLT